MERTRSTGNRLVRGASFVALLGLLAILPHTIARAAAEPDEVPAHSATPIADTYGKVAQRIFSSVMAGNEAFAKLERLCDDAPHRLAGSPGLERAIQWAADTMKADGHENVRIEPVMVNHWVRGRESLTMTEPYAMELPMLGLGGSVGTKPEGLSAGVVVVSDEEELQSLGNWAHGKILLFNNPMPKYDSIRGSGYGRAVRFRHNGARLAAEYGAVACLIRSVTATSLRTPHTGMMSYGDAKVRIPAAAICAEDADLLERLTHRGVEPRLTLRMEAANHPPARSGNAIGEIRGTTHPEQVVIISGHIDAWDVGQGAHDDGAGCVMAMEALTVIRRLGLTPKRTIRAVMWTNEEFGINGGRQYAAEHAAELANHVAALESDGGAFAPRGFSVECTDARRQAIAAGQLRDITTLLAELGANDIATGWSGTDIRPMREAGVVLLGHRVDGATYFDYHHSPADTLDKVDPELLSQNVAAIATLAFILADMPEKLGEETKR